MAELLPAQPALSAVELQRWPAAEINAAVTAERRGGLARFVVTPLRIVIKIAQVDLPRRVLCGSQAAARFATLQLQLRTAARARVTVALTSCHCWPPSVRAGVRNVTSPGSSAPPMSVSPCALREPVAPVISPSRFAVQRRQIKHHPAPIR